MEQVMDELCIDRLETEIGSIAGKIESSGVTRNTMQAITSMNTRLDQILGNQSLEARREFTRWWGSRRFNYRGPRDSTESYGAVIPRVTKLDFPRFNGSEDPTSWICRVEQFFEFQKIAEEEKVPLATYHLEGEAQLWLKQVGSRRSIKANLRNSSLSGEVKSVSTGCLFHWWSKGRCEDRCSSHETTNVVCSRGLAWLYEVKYHKRSSFNLEPKKTVSTNSTVTNRPLSSTPAIQRLSPTEMKERRDKGLCFNCDEKFALRHRCKKLFLIEGCWPEEDSGDEIGDIEENVMSTSKRSCCIHEASFS
ncbi:hypothetical protein AAG906_010710 [Vitis piasezkii]